MMYLSRCVWYYWFLVAFDANGAEVTALSPKIVVGNKPAFGFSSLPLLYLSSENYADDDGAVNDSSDNYHVDSDEDASAFLGEASNISQPTKSDLYGNDELRALLEMHHQLQSAMTPQPKASSIVQIIPQTFESPNEIVAGGLHDLILQTIDEIEDETKEDKPPKAESWISDDVRDKISKLDIIAVASDIDGTIIAFDQKIHPATIDSIKAAQDSSEIKWIFPATGKTRWGARNSLGPELSSLTEGPGVYVQGLYCLGKSDEVIFEKKLTSAAVEAAEQLIANLQTAVVAYDGDTLYTTDLNRIEVVELHQKFGEPESQNILSLSGHSPGVHKILLMDNSVEKLNQEVRPRLEELAKEYKCVVTQAVPTMLELLPFGCSKAKGVQMVCEYLDIDPESQLLAIGDAENDVEMLEVSAIGVAVGNSCDAAKNASDIVLPLKCSEGGVGMALKDILGVQC